MAFLDMILQDPGWILYKAGQILDEFRRWPLVLISLFAGWSGALVAAQLHELNWLGKALVTFFVTLLLFALVVSLSYLAPVFFDPDSLAKSQSVR